MFSRLRPLALATTLLLSSLASAALPITTTPVLAATTYIDCAVFWTPDDNAYVIITFDSARQAGGVANSGAGCTTLIQQGTWEGIDKNANYLDYGYARVCAIVFNSSQDTVVYAQSNYASQTRANQVCNSGGNSTSWY